MMVRKSISLLLALLILFPPTQGWVHRAEGQPAPSLEDQARFHLQRIPTPSPMTPDQIPPQRVRPEPAPAPEPSKIITTAPRQPEETSAAEMRAEEYGLPVKQFGYSFFYKPPDTFLPVQAVPVGPDYVIGPGDTVRIIIWGNVQGEYNLTVDRNGQIGIPKVGVVHVSGLSYKQLREVLNQEFARQYTNFQMNVTLDNLRTIQVFVVGQARFPGSYAVSSLSTLITALFAAGGPSKSGTMRDIQVRRGAKVIVHFDMYDFLIRGDKSHDIRLQPEDVIFIPPIGPLAAIGAPKREVIGLGAERGKAEAERVKESPSPVGGPVKVHGIYELKNERTLMDLINLAGGLAETAFKGRVQVLRIKDRREMVLFEDDLQKVMSGRTPEVRLTDGDFVKIFRVPDLVEKKVRITGAVKMPGEFGLRDNMRIKDLLEYAGGLLMQANREEAEITRVTVTPQGPETTRIYLSPQRALAGVAQDNILLKPNDYLFIRTVPEWDLYQLVKIEGEIKFPGTYALKKGETLSSLLTRAGGFTDKAYPKGTFFTRVAVKETQTQHLKQALDRIEAEILARGRAKTEAAMEKEDVERQKVIVAQQQMLVAKLREITPLGRVVIRLDDPERLRGTPWDLELQKEDSLMIPQIQQTVNVLGAVLNPTAIVYDPDLTVDDYVTRAGGPARYADVRGAYIIKVNGSALSRRGVKWFGQVWTGTEYTFQMGGFSSLTLEPGDSIVVPEELERISWLRELKDIAAILGNLALTAGVIFAAMR